MQESGGHGIQGPAAYFTFRRDMLPSKMTTHAVARAQKNAHAASGRAAPSRAAGTALNASTADSRASARPMKTLKTLPKRLLALSAFTGIWEGEGGWRKLEKIMPVVDVVSGKNPLFVPLGDQATRSLPGLKCLAGVQK